MSKLKSSTNQPVMLGRVQIKYNKFIFCELI